MVFYIETGNQIPNIDLLKQALKEAGYTFKGIPDEVVQITKKEYNYLMSRDNKLSAFEQGGVDNWVGIDDAIENWTADNGPLDPSEEDND